MFVIVLSGTILFGQSEPVIVQADSGDLGSDWLTYNIGEVGYITISTNGTANYPEYGRRVATYNITFPDSGTYKLYVKVRVGSAGADDDSYFYGNGFGIKDTVDADDWVRANQLSAAGYSDSADWVLHSGVAESNVWKWVNMSDFTKDEPGVTFTVHQDSLDQVFQIGARENGLSIDKFAFCKEQYYYTVYALDNRDTGTTTEPIINYYQPTGPPLANGKCKWLGSVYSNMQIKNFTHYWNQVTPENGGKWGSVEGTRDVMNWTELDSAYALAKNNGFPFRMHVLTWGAQQPSWISALTPAEQLEEIEEWFEAVAGRYDDIDYLEVTNEPINQPPDGTGSTADYIDALGGEGSTGYDWILEAFRMARDYFPETDLLINEYGIVSNSTLADEYVGIIELLQAEDLIDGIGVQAHSFSTVTSSSTMTNNLNKLAATELPIYATELDIGRPDDDTQMSEYMRIIPVFWEHPSVQGITLWGYRPGVWTDNAELVYADDSEKPALLWLRDYIANSTAANCVTGLPELPDDNRSEITVFPNPAKDGMFVIQGTESVQNIKIFGISGEKIKDMDLSGQEEIRIRLNTLPGIYIIELSAGDNRIFRKLLVE